ncbi:MAG TPA: DUF2027 domain-containing protein, partial [Bacteroidia bacterium]|nr:DUF2027 domain-containing protein [Bacteroidia bacterium]
TEGFEYNYPAAQLVPAEPVRTEPAKKQEETAPAEKNLSVSVPANTRFPDGIFLAFVPLNQHFPSASELEFRIINHSDYDVYYTISVKNGNSWICVESGALRPHAERAVDTLTPQQADEWGQVKTDVLFFSGDDYVHVPPVSHVTKFKGVKFFRDSIYNEHALTGKKSWVTEVFLFDDERAEEEDAPKLTNEDIRRMMLEKEKNFKGTKTSVPHLKNQVLEKEVDLHIEELLDNWAGMTNAQLIDVQLRKMQKELDAAIAAHLQRIIFIHGVGNGRLKQEVRKILSTYKNVRFHDASFQRYGFGATEAEIF